MAANQQGVNYTLSEALGQYNVDQVMTTNMWYIQIFNLPAEEEKVIKKAQIYGKGFTVPSRTNSFENVMYRGYEIPTPINLQMNHQHSMDIICDVGGWLRNAFLRWQARALDPRIFEQRTSFAADRRPLAGPGKATIRMNLLAPDMVTTITKVDLYGVRVESVGDITMTNDAGAVATFQVQFQSVFWEIQDGNAYTDKQKDPGERLAKGDINGGINLVDV